MSPRTGRPPKENPRNLNLNIRISKEEDALIKECSEQLGTTRTEVIVKGVKLVKSEIDEK